MRVGLRGGWAAPCGGVGVGPERAERWPLSPLLRAVAPEPAAGVGTVACGFDEGGDILE